MAFDFYGVPKSRIFDLLSILIETPSITINTPGISNQSLVYKLNNFKHQLMITHFKSVGENTIEKPSYTSLLRAKNLVFQFVILGLI